MMNNKNNFMIKIITHNGKFHSDDVFAVATLGLVLGDEPFEVLRTRDLEIIKSGDYVLDIGGEYDEGNNKFDHHQIGGAGERENGIPYASFGLVWKKFGAGLCGSPEVASHIDENLAQVVDAEDNGVDLVKEYVFPDVYGYTITGVVNMFRPTLKEKDISFDEKFLEAVSLARQIIEREIKITQDQVESEIKIKEAYNMSEDKQLVVFNEDGDYGRENVVRVLLEYPEPLYAVLYRSDVSNWQVVAINKDKKTFETRKPIPDKWRGLRGEELAEATGVPDAIFCHRGGFMCVSGSKEGAIKFAKLAMK
ncbi:MAG: MYG1 family protein [Parcubacteria group bacterium]|nr:MYG1 family protein [Parcubacteria group bacterium]MCR4342793.1 MYG1 family protein [Patescibacteria group bacterium]